MFIKEYYIDNWYMRRSKLGNQHTYNRKECDAKKFAQRKGVERKKIWNMSASSNLLIGKI